MAIPETQQDVQLPYDATLFLVEMSTRFGVAYRLRAFTCIENVLTHIASAVTGPEEDFGVSLDVVSASWEEWAATDADPYNWSFRRDHGPVNSHLSFSIVPVNRIIWH